MGLMARQNEESNIEPVPADTYHAVCFGAIDMGTQHNETYNVDQRKICLLWELPNLRYETTRNNEKMSLPRTIPKQYTLSLGEKANLFKDLTSWRGRAFTPDELEGFDVYEVIAANCLLGVIHEKSRDGKKTYAKIGSVSKLMQNMNKLEPENSLIRYSIEDDGIENIPKDTPKWIVKIIHKSAEYQATLQDRDCSTAPDIAGVDDEMAPTEIAPEDIPF